MQESATSIRSPLNLRYLLNTKPATSNLKVVLVSLSLSSMAARESTATFHLDKEYNVNCSSNYRRDLFKRRPISIYTSKVAVEKNCGISLVLIPATKSVSQSVSSKFLAQ